MAYNRPLVSIGLPVYNGERFIRRALDSLLAQTYENFELIISDNASDDGTVDICEEYVKRDSRLFLYKNSENIGVMPNFRRVLDLAQGEFFMWSAHDDYWASNYVSALLNEILVDDHFGLSCPKVVKVTPDDTIRYTHTFPDRDIVHQDIKRKNRILMANVQSAWVYGLYRITLLRAVYAGVLQTGLVWAADHLIILSFLLNQTITGTDDTTIYQTKTGLSAQLYKPKSIQHRLSFGMILLSQVIRILLASPLTLGQKLYLLPFLGLYLEMQVFHWRTARVAQLLQRTASHLYRDLKVVVAL